MRNWGGGRNGFNRTVEGTGSTVRHKYKYRNKYRKNEANKDTNTNANTETNKKGITIKMKTWGGGRNGFTRTVLLTVKSRTNRTNTNTNTNTKIGPIGSTGWHRAIARWKS